MPALTQRRQAVIFLLIAAILWSTSGFLVKIITWQPFSILSARCIIAALVMLIYLKGKPDFHWTRWQVLGAISYVGIQWTFLSATKMTTAANAIFLQYTAPLYLIPLAYWFLDERPHLADWLSMAAIFGGLFFFFGDRLSLHGLYGNLLAILSGVFNAFLTICLRKQKDGRPVDTILLGNILGGLLGLPFLLDETLTLASLGIALYLGVFQIGLSFILYSIAIRRVQAIEATLIVTLEPILNPVWVYLALGEAPGQYALTGILLVLGGVLGRAIVSARTPAATVAEA
jgi:drug/metabolite transporter (DMT)-like permease